MNKSNETISIIAGDVGGTKTNIGHFIYKNNKIQNNTIKKYINKDFNNLEEIIDNFKSDLKIPFSKICIGIAGPVINGEVNATNLPWSVNENKLKKHYKIRAVKIINDLTATAYSIPFLDKKNFYNLTPKIKKHPGIHNIAIIAPGTGLGGALLAYHKNEYVPIISEAGHMDYSPQTMKEISLLRFLSKKFGHVSEERVISGPGILNIYWWLLETKKAKIPDWLNEKIKTDGPKAISQAALNEKDKICVETIEIFNSLLGSFAGNIALSAMTIGGVYLGGGIPPKILPKLKEKHFIDAFVNKGRFKKYLENIPVYVIINDKAALFGAFYYGIHYCCEN